MNTQQRTKHVSKVQSLAIEDEHELSTESELTQRTMEPVHEQEAAPIFTSLSVNVESAAKGLSIPLTCIQGVWKKAAELLHKPNSMVTAPGQCAEARMVLSYSGKVPHMVVPSKGGGYSCDSNWKSIGFCSHTVAVAEANGKLPQLVAYLQKKKRVPNLTNLVTSNMPRGRGRKGGATPRTRKQLPSPTRVSMTVGQAGTSRSTASTGFNFASGSTASTEFNFAPTTIMLSQPATAATFASGCHFTPPYPYPFPTGFPPQYSCMWIPMPILRLSYPYLQPFCALFYHWQHIHMHWLS